MDKRRIYLDYSATTPVDPRVLDAMLPFFGGTFGNASSVHAEGRIARGALEQARETIAAALGISPGELVFTSGGTEADNAALAGALHAAMRRGRPGILTAAAEHHAVLDTCGRLRADGAQVRILPVDPDGQVSPVVVAEALGPNVGLVSVMHANNEVGTINPVRAIADAAHAAGALAHTDAVQSFGKIPVAMNDLGVDLLSVSAHKIHGPKGIGALAIRNGTEMPPMQTGGGQERGRRGGTENVALAVGFARAVELALEALDQEHARLAGLRDALASALRERFPFLVFNGHPTERLPHVLNVAVDADKGRVEGEMLVPSLDLEGIAVSSGSACSSGSIQPSHVLRAMGRGESTARAAIRFSLGKGTTREEILETVERMEPLLQRMVRPV